MSASDRPFAPLLFAHEYALQGASPPHLREEYLYGGPNCRQDRRLYLTRQELHRLLEQAEASINGRVLLPFCGIRVRVYEDSQGHIFEVLTLSPAAPRPEMTGLTLDLPPYP